ncbi:MAG: hypothetical protein JJE30_06585, partial [Desulfuromonadales bacterium]|nr:hypothetical protein [Desulfuromonadales bacterium]
MKLLFTSDIHASRNHLAALLSVAGKNGLNCIIIGGDIVPHDLPRENRVGLIKAQGEYLAAEFIPTIRAFKERNPDTLIFLDMANDDFIWNRQILEAREGHLFSLLHMKVQRLTDQVDIAGCMTVPVTPFMIKDWEKPDTNEHPIPGTNASLNGYSSISGKREKQRMNPSSDDTIANDLALLSEKIIRPF